MEHHLLALLQLHLSDQQFYCPLRCCLYQRFYDTLHKQWKSNNESDYQVVQAFIMVWISNAKYHTNNHFNRSGSKTLSYKTSNTSLIKQFELWLYYINHSSFNDLFSDCNLFNCYWLILYIHLESGCIITVQHNTILQTSLQGLKLALTGELWHVEDFEK